MKNTRLPKIGAKKTKKLAAQDIRESEGTCYLNMERLVFNYCNFANKAFRIV